MDFRTARSPFRAILPILGAVIGSLALGCRIDDPVRHAGGGNATLNVVATTGMIADMVRRVAGEGVRVESLMSTGVDPHLYKASEGDVRRLIEADVVFFNGLHLEGKMAEVLERLGRTRRVVAVADALPRESLRQVAGFEGSYDPHLWFDVALWSVTAERIADTLGEALPARAARFRAAGGGVRRSLEELDRWVAKAIASIPVEQRLLITAHDAFGYFGRRYGIEVVGLQGMSTLSQAGVRDVERVVDLIVRRRVKAIFVESSVPKRTVDAVREAVRSRGHEVAIGGQLYSDSMGPPGSPDGTYAGMVRHNVNTLVEALSR